MKTPCNSFPGLSLVGVAQHVKEPQRDWQADSQLPGGDAPLSFAQQRLWFVYRLRPGNPAYHQTMALRLTGRLDAAVAERSLREVVHRHETLRTVFRTVGGQLSPVVLPDVPCPLPIVDLSHLPPAEREAEAARRVAVEFRRAFDLERGPLLRAGLLRLAAEDHVLWLEAHQIACDGGSMGILVQDFAAVYTAFLRGEPSPLPPLPVCYADYAAAQRDRMQGETLRKHLTYWKQQLDGLAESLELPTDRPRPAKRALQGGTRFFSLPLALTEALESLGRREGAWLFMTLLAGFQALLQRYTGQDDIAVGAPVADRPQHELHKMIGCFLNLVVLRTDLSGALSFRELLRRVRTMALRAYAHQELPFERLVEELRPACIPGRSPLFQVMFTLLNDPTRGMTLPGLKVAPIAVDYGVGLCDLRLVMTRTEAGLEGAFEYDSALFDVATIDRMIGHFKVLLEATVADPDRRLSDLPLPLTPNGKVDRSALPKVAVNQALRSYIPPRTQVEEKLAAIWAELFDLDKVGVHDSFFDLGGYSLLAVQLVQRINSRLGCRLEVADVFRKPTVAELAQHLAMPRDTEATPRFHHLEVLRRGNGGPPVVVVGSFPILQLLLQWLPADVTVCWLKVDGFNTHPCRIREIPDIGVALANELLNAISSESFIVVGFCWTGLVAFDLTQRLQQAGRKVISILLEPATPAIVESSRPTSKVPVVLAPASSRKWVRRHLEALGRTAPSTWLSYFWHRIKATLHAASRPWSQALRGVLPSHFPWQLRLKIRLRAALSTRRHDDLRESLLWWHLAPQVRNRVRSYQPTSRLGVFHIFGRAEWLDIYSPLWERVASAKFVAPRGPDPKGHHSITELPAAEAWLELVLKEAKSQAFVESEL